MTVVIATVEAGKVHVIADTGCVLGDTVIQSDCKLRRMQIAGEPCIVGLAGSGSGLEQAEALLALPPVIRPGRPGACSALLQTMRGKKVAKDDSWEVLVAFGARTEGLLRPEIYVITKDGMTGPTQRGAIGCGATAGMACYAALEDLDYRDSRMHTPEDKLESAVRGVQRACEGVVGGPGEVWVL